MMNVEEQGPYLLLFYDLDNTQIAGLGQCQIKNFKIWIVFS